MIRGADRGAGKHTIVASNRSNFDCTVDDGLLFARAIPAKIAKTTRLKPLTRKARAISDSSASSPATAWTSIAIPEKKTVITRGSWSNLTRIGT